MTAEQRMTAIKVKIAASLAVALLACACASAPVGTYSPVGQQAYNADQLLKDVTALSQTAINLNAATGREHLSDADTRYVRDFALSSGAALDQYASGAPTLKIVVTSLQTLLDKLSDDAKANTTFATALAFVKAGVAAIPVQ